MSKALIALLLILLFLFVVVTLALYDNGALIFTEY